MIAIIKKETNKTTLSVIDDLDLDNLVLNVEEPIVQQVEEIVETIIETPPIKEELPLVNVEKPKQLSIEDIKKQIQEKISGFNKK